MAIATAYVDIKPNMSGIHRETKKGLTGVESEFDATGKRSGGKFTGALGKAAKVGAAGVAVATGAAFGAALTKGFGRLKAIDDAQASLRGLGLSASEVDSVMKSANESVLGTAFGLDQAAGAAAIMKSAGVELGSDMTKSLKLIADSAVIANTDMADMAPIWAKVAARGKLDGEVLNQLLERQIGILPALAKHYNVSNEAAQKMVSEGKVSFKDFSTVMEDTLGGAAQQAGKTFTGAWANVGAALGRIGAVILTPFFKAAIPAMARLTAGLDSIKKALEPVMASFETWMNSIDWSKAGAGLQPLWNAFGQLVPVLAQLWANLSPISLAFKALQPSLPILGNALGELAQTVAGLLGTALRAILPVIGQLVGVLGGVLLQVFQAIIPVVTQLAQFLGPILGTMMTALSPIITAVAQVVGSLVQALLPVVQVVMNLITTVLPPLLQIFQALSPILAVIGQIVGFLAQVIGVVLTAAINILMPVINVLANVLSFVLVVALKAVTFVINSLVWYVRNVLAPAFNWLWANVVTPVFNGIKLLISTWWLGVKIIFNAVVTFLKNTFGPVFTAFGAGVKIVWDAIRTVISTVWNASVKPIFDAIVAFVRDTLQPRFNFLKSTVESVWASIRKKIGDVWTWVKDNVFSPLSNAVKEGLPGAFEAGKKAIGRAWDGLRALARKPVAFVIETIIRDGLVKPFNKVAKVFGAKGIDEKIFTVPKLATGGKVPGYSPTATADNVPIWATAGEFMVRRKSSDKLRRKHPGLLEHINKYGDVPGYAKGGNIVALGKALQRIGVRVSEHPAFGGVHPVHAKNSWHYRAGALDLNTAPGQSAGEMAFFDKLMPILHGMGWGTIWRYPNHYGHAHVDMGGRKLGNFKTGGVGNLIAKGLFSALKGLNAAQGAVTGAFKNIVDLNPFKGLIDKIKSGVGKTPFAQMIGSGAKGLVNKAVQWMQDKMPFGGDTGSVNDPGGQGGGVGRWADTVRKALTMLGQPTSDAMVNTVLRRMKQESSGNPRSINNWDSNARRGTPSKGLMQVIGPTFKQYAMKGFNKDIYDPLSNILASMRYAIARYGSLSSAYNKKGGYADGGTVTPTLYDSGGWLQPGLTTVLNATGKPEAVFTSEQLSAMKFGADSRWNIENLTVADPDEFVRAVDARERRREILSPI